jgi:uncharacterized membrane protein
MSRPRRPSPKRSSAAGAHDQADPVEYWVNQFAPGACEQVKLTLPKPRRPTSGSIRTKRGEVCYRRDMIEPVRPVREAVILFRGGDTHSRSVLKAISWRTLGTFDTFAISWFLTGKVGLAGSIAALEFATKIVWYYLHERVWAAAPWGRR